MALTGPVVAGRESRSPGAWVCLAFCALVAIAACRKEEKRPVRTEPWPAPAVSLSAAIIPGAVVKYALESGSVRIELKSRRTRFNATIERLDGELEFDPARMEKTRATVRGDLLSLTFSEPLPASLDENELTLTALRALELTAERPPEERERDRWAIMRVVGFETPRSDDSASGTRKKTPVTAFAELTLHRFRVPVTLALDVELIPESDAGAPRLQVRTRRPAVVQLAAHDLAPSDPAKPAAARRSDAILDGAREARVSAELSWRATGATSTSRNNP